MKVTVTALLLALLCLAGPLFGEAVLGGDYLPLTEMIYTAVYTENPAPQAFSEALLDSDYAYVTAENAAGVTWGPDWPVDFPPDAFSVIGGRLRSITVISDDPHTTSLTLSRGDAGDQSLILGEFPLFYGGAFYQVHSLFDEALNLSGFTVDGEPSWEMRVNQYQNGSPAMIQVIRGEKTYFVMLDSRGTTAAETWYDSDGTGLLAVNYRYDRLGGEPQEFEIAFLQAAPDTATPDDSANGSGAVPAPPPGGNANDTAVPTENIPLSSDVPNEKGTVTITGTWATAPERTALASTSPEGSPEADASVPGNTGDNPIALTNAQSLPPPLVVKFSYDSFGNRSSLSYGGLDYSALYRGKGRPRYVEIKGPDFYSHYSFQWDMRGLLVRLTLSTRRGDQLEEKELRYEYTMDRDQNWIERRETTYAYENGFVVPRNTRRFMRDISYPDNGLDTTE